MLVDFSTCELQRWATDADNLLKVFNKFQDRRKQTKDLLKADLEYVTHQGQIHVGRYYPLDLPSELFSLSSATNAALDVGTPGRVNTLRWMQTSHEMHNDTEVEIEVQAAGLNFRVSDSPCLSFRCLLSHGCLLTRHRRISSSRRILWSSRRDNLVWRLLVLSRGLAHLSNIRNGDRVVCLKKSAFTKYLCVPEFACAKVPATVGLEEASSMLVPCTTAIDSLINVGQLAEDQVSLIHDACSTDRMADHFPVCSNSQCMWRRWSRRYSSRADG